MSFIKVTNFLHLAKLMIIFLFLFLLTSHQFINYLTTLLHLVHYLFEGGFSSISFPCFSFYTRLLNVRVAQGSALYLLLSLSTVLASNLCADDVQVYISLTDLSL